MLTFIKKTEKGLTSAKNIQLSCNHHWKFVPVREIIHLIAWRQCCEVFNCNYPFCIKHRKITQLFIFLVFCRYNASGYWITTCCLNMKNAPHSRTKVAIFTVVLEERKLKRDPVNKHCYSHAWIFWDLCSKATIVMKFSGHGQFFPDALIFHLRQDLCLPQANRTITTVKSI